MRPDIDAGPIGLKWSVSNGLVPATAGVEPCSVWPTRDWAPNAAARVQTRMRARTGFIWGRLHQHLVINQRRLAILGTAHLGEAAFAVKAAGAGVGIVGVEAEGLGRPV